MQVIALRLTLDQVNEFSSSSISCLPCRQSLTMNPVSILSILKIPTRLAAVDSEILIATDPEILITADNFTEPIA